MRVPIPGSTAAGGLPKLQDKMCFYRRYLLHTRVWRSRVRKSRSPVGRKMKIRRVYEYALQREHEGKTFFERNAQRMSHAAATGIFKQLAAEEQKHITFIEALLRSLDGGEGDTQVGAVLEDENRFAQRAESEMLDQTVIESMIPDVAILRMAYLIERDFAEFYEQSSAQAEGEAKDALAALARWERGHEALFKALHDRVFQEYAEMPWGG